MAVLHPIESRFPLTRSRVEMSAVEEIVPAETADGARPFGLRFFVTETAPLVEPVFGYSDEQQVTVDDAGQPVVHGPTAGWNRTTTGNMDGNEETTMDRDPDSA